MIDRWRHSHFDSQDEEPLGPLANLVDIILVFAVGLIAALISTTPELARQLAAPQQPTQQIIEKGREIPQLPSEAGQAGSGYESVGQVFRDSQTGKLILIGEERNNE